MSATDNHNTYLNIRSKYPYFTYNGFRASQREGMLMLEFEFRAGEEYLFTPRWEINTGACTGDLARLEELKFTLFNLGMIEMISYWKAFCSPRIIIHGFRLSEEQQQWWKKLYRFGLGEFFYTNNIPQPGEELLEFVFAPGSASPYRTEHRNKSLNGALVPVGGGKDSAVGLEIMKKTEAEVVPFVINPREATGSVLKAAGFTPGQSITVKRSIDPLLIELNRKGFLNGHTPFSALLAFASVYVAQLCGLRDVVLSNESSANEASVPGTDINHQYSKSYAFEKDFRTYVYNYIDDSVNYFSLLRPLNEVQISALFAGYRQYHSAFKSCNAGSKEDVWCCKCPKCLFTFIMLSPFMDRRQMLNVFGKDLFADESLTGLLNALSGNTQNKPFECVGTYDEVNSALAHMIKQWEAEQADLPFLLDHNKNSATFPVYREKTLNELLIDFNGEHFLGERYEHVLKAVIRKAFA